MSKYVGSPARKSAVRTKLRSGVVKMFFRKENGQFRSILATLSPKLIETFPTGRKPRQIATANTLTVWSLVDGGWRTIRYDRLISCKS
jgi:hypothetical protein